MQTARSVLPVSHRLLLHLQCTSKHASGSDWRWRQQFTKRVIGPAAEFMALAKPVRYSEVLELDQKILEFNSRPIPSELIGDTADMGAIVRRSSIGVFREIGNFTMHSL